MKAKPIHGAPVENDVPYDMVEEDPHGSGLKKGDMVTFTNDYGVKFHGREVRGFAKDKHSVEFGGRWVYIHKDSWWFPEHPDCLKLEASK